MKSVTIIGQQWWYKSTYKCFLGFYAFIVFFCNNTKSHTSSIVTGGPFTIQTHCIVTVWESPGASHIIIITITVTTLSCCNPQRLTLRSCDTVRKTLKEHVSFHLRKLGLHASYLYVITGNLHLITNMPGW